MTIDPKMLDYLLIGMAVTALSGLLGFLAQAIHIWKSLKGDPQRRSVRMEDDYATKPELRELKAHIEKMELATDVFRREIHNEIETVNSKGEERSVKIHERINDLGASITESLGSLKGQVAILVQGRDQ